MLVGPGKRAKKYGDIGSIVKNKKLDKLQLKKLFFCIRKGETMSISLCLDELHQKEDSVANKIPSVPSLKTDIFFGASIFLDLKYILGMLKKIFESNRYDLLIQSMSKIEMKELLDDLKGLAHRTENIQDALSRKIKFYYQPLMKNSIKTAIDINDMILEKIEDFELSLNPKFVNSMEKILESIEESDFDISKVQKIDSFL